MRWRRFLSLLALSLLLSLLLVSPVSARGQGGRPLATTLTGAQEVPAGDPNGSGTARLRLNPGQGRICYTLTATGLSGTITAAHIHVAPPGVAGPIVVPLQPPVGGQVSACTTASRELIVAIIQHPEHYYVNVHTSVHPSGAIRGQLSK
jgi:hypothetical protein